MFGIYTVSGILVAKSPIYHGGNEKSGSTCMLNREKFITNNGVEEVPIISGNAVRGVLRRLIMKDLLGLLSYKLKITNKKDLKLYHTLFSGGILEQVSEKESISLKLKKELIDNVPPIRLFGLSFGNQMIEGKLKIGQMLPICKELSDFLPHTSDVSYYDLLSTTFQTHKDDIKDTSKRDKNDSVLQMIVEYEVFSPGTRFYHEIKLEDPDDNGLDISCLARCLELWKQKPYIGGKSAIGFGELEINYDISENSKKYVSYINENKETIVSLFDELINKT